MEMSKDDISSASIYKKETEQTFYIFYQENWIEKTAKKKSSEKCSLPAAIKATQFHIALIIQRFKPQ